MATIETFKLPSRKGAVPIIDPSSGSKICSFDAGDTHPVEEAVSRTQASHKESEKPSRPEQGNDQGRRRDEFKDRAKPSSGPRISPEVASANPLQANPLYNGSQRSSTSLQGQDTPYSATPRLYQTNWRPDINAPSYIPSYLWAIQRSPAIDRYSQQLKLIDFSAYIQSFAGTRYLESLPPVYPEVARAPITISRNAKNLDPTNYFDYFAECLKLEAFNHSESLSPLILFNTNLEPVDPQNHLYSLRVPGLKDGTPHLDLGDVVVIRQFFPHPQITQDGLKWLSENQNNPGGSIAPGFTGLQLHCYVWGISRATESVIIRVDNFIPSSNSCNASFTLPVDLYVPQWRAIQKVIRGVSWSPKDVSFDLTRGLSDERSWFYRMLFPKEKDCVIQKTLPKGSFEHQWNDSQLNYEQQKAVDSIVTRNYGNVPFLISGVPGSGKTKTVVECALQLLQNTSDVTPHLLICAPSNPAADTLAMRLSSHLKPNELFRLNGWNRTFAEVPGELLPYTYTEDEIFSLPAFQTMMKYKVIVTTCKDADMLVQARLTNENLMKLAYETISAVAPGVQLEIEKLLHWTALIVDEAAQATEPSVCIPLTVVSTPLAVGSDTGDKSSLPLLIMAGDEHQLAPRVYNSETALSTSLFERLFARSLYANHPLSRRNAGPYKKLTKSMLPIVRPPFVNLTRNYRSHPAIIAIPSVLFYSDTLIPSATPPHPQGPVPTWPGWRGEHNWPVLFSCNASQDQVEDVLTHGVGTGVYNAREASIALGYVQSLLFHSSTMDYSDYGDSRTPPKPIAQNEIAIITPFLAQVSYLRKVFRYNYLHDVNIGPLEAFQGLETRFLIICTTRTRPDQRFLVADQSRALGIVGEKQRFNMAITRAKEGVIVIGNPNVLVGTGKDETWRAFLGFCARNGCWTVERGADHVTESTSKSWFRMLGGRDGNSIANFDFATLAYVSRLEKGLRYGESLMATNDESQEAGIDGDAAKKKAKARQRRLGNIREDQDSEAAMWTAGLAAEEVLRGALDNH